MRELLERLELLEKEARDYAKRDARLFNDLVATSGFDAAVKATGDRIKKVSGAKLDGLVQFLAGRVGKESGGKKKALQKLLASAKKRSG